MGWTQSPLLGATLACLKARVRLADDVDTTATADDLALLVTLLERAQGVADLHDGLRKRVKTAGS